MRTYEIVNIHKKYVSYKIAETHLKAALEYFRETGNIDGPWNVVRVSDGHAEVVEVATVVALAYHENNIDEPEDTWVLT